MRYTSKQIIERAMNLADISNTDFLTHTELTQYINDSWQTVYQWLINKGDKQFVKEVLLETAGNFHDWTEFELPKDLYQICSIKNRMTGALIERAAESESVNSGKYDVINDRIRLYGNSHGPLLLTYWTVPTFISFPDKSVDCDKDGTVLDYCNNSILLDNGDIYNCTTGELIASLNLESEDVILGNGVVIVHTDNDYTVMDYNGNTLNTLTDSNTTTYHFFKDKSGSIFYQTLSSYRYSAPKSVLTDGAYLSVVDYETDGYPLFITSYSQKGDWIYYDATEEALVVYNEEADDVFYIGATGNTITWEEDFNNKPCFYITSNSSVDVYTYDNDGEVETDRLRIRPQLIKARLRYGILDSNGTFSTLISCVPDTELNFPNELYFSLIACDLALRFAMKMNANTDGLNNLYQNMQTTFMNTLSQAADYTRIKNVY